MSLSLLLFGATAAESRPNTVELALMSSVGNPGDLMYHVNFTVGSPGQLQTITIDTGSSQTFLLASNASFCKANDCDSGTFDLTKSSTFEKTNPGALVQRFMGGSTWFKGDYVRDVVQMSWAAPPCLGIDLLTSSSDDLVISKIPFGLADRLKHTIKPYTGIMGLGYSKGKTELPPTFVEGLVQAGAIPSRLYSIYLNTLDRYGSILFGGFDTDKYRGPLTTLNLVRGDRNEQVDNFLLYIEEIKTQPYNDSGQTILRSTNDTKHLTVLDTGTPDWRLPMDVWPMIVEYAGAEYSSVTSSLARPCNEVARGAANTTHFEITFAGNGSNTANLRVELADLFAPVTTKDGSAVADGTGRPMCELAVAPQNEFLPFSIISSSVMRAGYWVFDLDNGQVSMAQANLGANSSNVVSVEAGPEGLKKVAKDLKAETQRDEVEGLRQVSVAYELSTATNTIGYATGIKSYSTPTGTGAREPVKVHNSPRSRGNPHVRRAENAAATTMNFGAHVVWVLCAAVLAAVGVVAV